MLILGIETSGDAGGAALYDADAGVILGEIVYRGARAHGRRLVSVMRELTASAGRTPAEISAVAVSCGPGSFTGLRIGVATANALAQTLSRRAVAVPTMRAVAEQLPGAARVLVVAPSRKGEVYAAGYTRNDLASSPVESLPVQALGVEELVNAVAPAWHAFEGGKSFVVSGEAAQDIHAALTGIIPGAAVLAPASLRSPRPATIAVLGAQMIPRFGQGGEMFSPALPFYVVTPTPQLAAAARI